MKKKTPKKPKVRKKWIINPHIRIKKSLKLYNRAKAEKEFKEIKKRLDNEKDT